MKSFSLFSSSDKYDDALELYEKAAAQYKATKNWQEVADVYLKCAEICEKQKRVDDACTHYANCGKAYRHFDAQQAVAHLQIACDMNQESGRFSSAAKLYKDIAQLHEKLLNTKEAIKAWGKAADCYEAEDSVMTGNQCRLNAANLYAENGEYKKAIDLFERIAKSSLDSSTAKFSVKDYLYKAILCHFVLACKKGELAAVQAKLDEYKDMLPAFDGARECKLVEEVLQAFENDELEDLTNAINKYHTIYKLDDFSTRCFYEIKMALKNGTGEEDGNDLT